MKFVSSMILGVGSIFMLSSVNANNSPTGSPPVYKKEVRSQPVVVLAHHRQRQQARGYQTAHKKHRTRSKHKTRSAHVSSFRGGKRAFPSRIRPTGKRVFIFSPRRLAWAADTPDGRLVGYGRASGGASWCRDIGRSCRTPRGTFRISRKGSSGCRSGSYPRPRGGAPMPYCMFFMRSYAIHGSPNVPNHNASHGCIRVKPPAAAWLSRHFIHRGTTVIVTSY